jgi:hypothetical protein
MWSRCSEAWPLDNEHAVTDFTQNQTALRTGQPERRFLTFRFLITYKFGKNGNHEGNAGNYLGNSQAPLILNYKKMRGCRVHFD